MVQLKAMMIAAAAESAPVALLAFLSRLAQRGDNHVYVRWPCVHVGRRQDSTVQPRLTSVANNFFS